jgi:hypothetical protein
VDVETLFWVIHLPLMLLLLIGLVDVAGIWLRGRVEGADGASAGRKFIILLGRALRAIFSRQFPVILKAFITEAWFTAASGGPAAGGG